jgi:hypothetical protein
MSIGATTASTGRFTNLTVTGSFTAGGGTGTNGQVLVSTGTGIQWATSSSIANGTSNVSVALNGNVTVTTAGTLATTFNNTNVNIPMNTASSTTSSGALTVTGGVGIGGNLFAGGTANITGVTNLAGGLNVVCNPFRFQRSAITQTGQDDNVSVTVGDGDITFTHNNDDDGDSSTFNFSYTTAGAAVNLLSINATGVTYRANTIWHAGNDGAGSGLDADTLDGFGTSQAASGTTIPVRDSNGYLYGNYINMSDNSQTSGVTAIICKAGDNFYRSATAAATATFISGQTMNIAGNAATVTNGVYTTGNQTIGGNKTFTGTTGLATTDVNTSSALSFGSQTRQMVNLWGTSYGLGVQSSTLYYRTGGRFSWFRGGIHSDTENTAGSGGTVAMTLDSASNLTVTGTITEQSSIRYKENVNPIDNALEKVLQLQGVTYDRKDGTAKNEPGMIAEEVANVIPNLVSYNDDGIVDGIHYSKTVAYLVECIKELNAKIERLEGKQ